MRIQGRISVERSSSQTIKVTLQYLIFHGGILLLEEISLYPTIMIDIKFILILFRLTIITTEITCSDCRGTGETSMYYVM